MITFEHATKRYGGTLALDDLTVEVRPGRVTGLLGPNGAGKSTALRLLLGLDGPTAGRALVGGRPYRAHRRPLSVAGALLDGRAVHPGRSARNHLLGLARAGGIPVRRVDEVLDVVGLTGVARRRAGGLSLGMGQRLGMAAALLGDPAVVVLDEPVNGLDTDGVRWVRTLLRNLAAEGRTVLLSSHLMAELHQTADHVVVLGRGRLLADCPTAELAGRAGSALVLRSPDVTAVAALPAILPGSVVVPDPGMPGQVRITGATAEAVGNAAATRGIRVHHLAPERATLEEGYLRLVAGAGEYVAGGYAAGGQAAGRTLPARAGR